jgi:hypothetical protein
VTFYWNFITSTKHIHPYIHKRLIKAIYICIYNQSLQDLNTYSCYCLNDLQLYFVLFTPHCSLEMTTVGWAETEKTDEPNQATHRIVGTCSSIVSV